jgi:DNA-binding transcriptional MocR family regulator
MRVFLHLLLTANYEPHDFECITVERGQRVASYGTLAEETGLSIRNVRTAIEHLKSTGEVTSTVTPKFSVFTVNNYDKYQLATSTSTSDRQATDKQSTSDRQQWKKDNKDKNQRRSPSDFLFEKFWAEYPRRTKKDLARREFEKYMNDERLKDYSREERVNFLVQAVKAWSSSEQWQMENGKFIPNAVDWLKDEKYTQKYLRELKATQTEVWSGYPELGADLKHD